MYAYIFIVIIELKTFTKRFYNSARPHIFPCGLILLYIMLLKLSYYLTNFNGSSLLI
jgi:hypothetical protein